ncbi:MAG: hypothetical protein A2033_08500 [Bacteroidetes bacterium GWA2_31_9]|nr:MAG: hypothetical protein A2033_08500 [Bacteroidetes bacterium GWA2_31_9]
MIEWFEYGYFGLFVASFLAATIIPFSSEALLSLLIYSDYNIYYCIVIATIGNTVGGMSSFYLGYIGKWHWLEKYFGIKKEKIDRLHQKMKFKGSLMAFLTWLPIVGDLIAVLLGVLRVNTKYVVIFMFLGKLARYIVWAYLTNLFV